MTRIHTDDLVTYMRAPRVRQALHLVAPMVLLVGTLALSACESPDTFRPIYYPDASNLLAYTRGPSVDNLAQARQWAEDQKRQRGDTNSTYEVGKNCRPFGGSDLEVCEETLR